MTKKTITFLVITFACYGIFAQERTLSRGMKITKTTKIKKQVYKLDAYQKMEQAVVIIEGENITVDFNNAVLQGSNPNLATPKNPDEFFGVALLIKNSKKITIKNLKAKGFKVALFAQDVESLTIENCDFSYNYRPRLNSTQEKEDISDWMSYHHNENDEWLQYGAAIYLRDCNLAIIRNNKVTGGQNALMMTRCDEGLIYNNDFSYNSGIGIGFYRSSNNKIVYNKINFNVRGYSHGVYNRGQDSAGILVYEQSNKNLFYKNSVTHSGDGFFLWAGQTTMDNGQGGCNDNALVENDFSYAPTNGIEVTFSRNYIYKNRIYECDHGIWGGYSYNTRISNNNFRYNRIGIAIENGQDNSIDYNVFYEDREAIRLWARNEQPSDWGYARHRDTRSRDYLIAMNSFNNVRRVFNLNRTENLHVFGNTFSGSLELFRIDSTVTSLDTTENSELREKLEYDTSITFPLVENAMNPFKGSGLVAGRKNILMTEWGPYDFRSPIIWNINPTDSSSLMKFILLGPKGGKWKIKNFRGVKSISVSSGVFPDTITATKINGARTDIFIQLEFTGPAITSQLGQNIPAGKPYIFSFKKFFQPIQFHVRWYSLDTAIHNPIKTGQLLPPNVRMMPIATDTTDKLDYAWWGGIKANQQYKQFITVAEGSAELPKGNYELGVTWDDAVRVYVDGKPVIDEWNPSLYKFDESPYKKVKLQLGGKHFFTVEHLELGGFATLSLKLKPVE